MHIGGGPWYFGAMEFSPKELLFAETVANGSSLSDAYRFAYLAGNMNAMNVGREAYRVATRPHVAALIVEKQKEAAKKFRITREWLMNWHYQRVIYDPGEITRMVVGACRHCHGDGHGFQWREPDYMAALAKAEQAGDPLPDIAGGFGYSHARDPHPACPQCDGRGVSLAWFADTSSLSPAARMAFEGVKETKTGLEIKMADKHASALELAKLAGLHVEQVKLLNDIPDAADLAALSPVEIANAYKRAMGTAH